MLSLLLLPSLLCVSTPYISAARPYDHGRHPLLMTTKTYSLGQPQHHKRQDQEIAYCDKVISAQYCTNGSYQELADMWEKCSENEGAKAVQSYCLQTSKGDYCINLIGDTSPIQKACENSSSTCAQTCKELLVNTHNQLGCCIPSLFNNSEFSVEDRASYNYSLWSSCGVEPVTQKCPPGPIVIHPTPVDPTCSTEAVAQARLQSIACRKQYVEDIRNKLSATKDCKDYMYPKIGDCNANVHGTYCKTMSPPMDQDFTAASKSCRDTSTCDPLCIETLSNITDTAGCCFMDQYNATSGVTEKWLSYEFWSRCDLKSPGHCKEFLNNGPTVLKAHSMLL